MSRTLFFRNLTLASILTLALAFITAVPALADNHPSGAQFCAGENYTVDAGQNIETLLAFGCNVAVEQGATIRGDLALFGGNASVAGSIGGNISSFGSNVSLASTAVVNGGITSAGGNVERAEGAVVQGGVNHTGRNFTPPVAPAPPVAPVAPMPPSPFSRAFNLGFDLLGGIVTALAFSALGALIVIFAPEPTRRIGNAVQAKPLNVAGVGCLTLILLPILGLLLVITLIGIPVALVLFIASVVAWVFGWVAIGYLTGEKILQAFKARDILPVVAVILGVLVLTLISQVDFIGWLVSLVVGLLGIGAVVLTRFGTRAYPLPQGMMMTPVAAAGPSAPSTFTPSAVDMAAWEAKARETEARNATPPAAGTRIVDVPPGETPSPDVPPSDVPPGGRDEGKPNSPVV